MLRIDKSERIRLHKINNSVNYAISHVIVRLDINCDCGRVGAASHMSPATVSVGGKLQGATNELPLVDSAATGMTTRTNRISSRLCSR